MANVDTHGQPFDGAKTYRLRLPKDIPAARFWSLTLYDNQARSMVRTDQRYPRAGSQIYSWAVGGAYAVERSCY
jgi:hypothetical protein